MMAVRKVRRKVIAFCGFEQSGKDFSCKRLVTTRGFKKTAFANALRDIAFATIGKIYAKDMDKYEELKQTKIYDDLTFRNIMENLGSAVRRYDENFWIKGVIKDIEETTKNVCVSDLRYFNEYLYLKNYCKKNDINFKLVFCDYHSLNYNATNMHESTKLAHYLKDAGYEDQQEVSDITMANYSALEMSTLGF